jgi:hypothetical protein
VASANIKAALKSYLCSLGPLVALVGDRIYFGEQHRGKRPPSVAFWRTSSDSVVVATGPGGMSQATFTIECRGNSAEEADAVAETLMGFDDFYGAFMGTVWIAAAVVRDASDDKSPPAHGESRSDHRVVLEVTLFFDD